MTYGHASASTAAWIACFIALLLSGVLSGALAAPRSTPVATEAQWGRAIQVHDGDSLHVTNTLGQRIRIRVAGIDAPELDQPYGFAARDWVWAAVRDQPLRLEPIKRDVYGRIVARVIILSQDPSVTAEQDLGLGLIQAGLAWHFVRYRADQTRDDVRRYAAAQTSAREAARGLWQDPDALPPWTFRARNPSDHPRAPSYQSGCTAPSSPRCDSRAPHTRQATHPTP